MVLLAASLGMSDKKVRRFLEWGDTQYGIGGGDQRAIWGHASRDRLCVAKGHLFILCRRKAGRRVVLMVLWPHAPPSHGGYNGRDLRHGRKRLGVRPSLQSHSLT